MVSFIKIRTLLALAPEEEQGFPTLHKSDMSSILKFKNIFSSLVEKEVWTPACQEHIG